MASGDTLFVLLPIGSIPTTTLFATLDTINDGSTVVGQIPVLDFDGVTANEVAEWLMMMPSQYDGGGLTFEINYSMDGTDTEVVQFEIRAIQQIATDAIGSQDLGAQTAVEVVDTPNGTANTMDIFPTGALSHANAGSPAVGDIVRIRLTRDFDHEANTDDLQLIAVYVTET